MAKVSVIVPCFNCAPYVGETIGSISVQTEADLEIICVDDGSTDGTLVELQRLARQEPRLRVFPLPHSAKPSSVRNAGIRRATGDYVAFLDGDDLYDPRKIQRQVAVLERFASVGVVFTDMRVFWGHPRDSQKETYLDSYAFKTRAAQYMRPDGDGVFVCGPDFYKFMSIEVTAATTQTIMIRRSVFGAGEPWFREDLAWAEDVELWLRLARDQKLAFIDEVLAYYRQRPDSISKAGEGPVRMAQWLVAVHEENLVAGGERFDHEDRGRYARRIAHCLFELGYMHSERRQMRAAWTAYLRSLRVSPEWRTVMALLKSLAPRPLKDAARVVGATAYGGGSRHA